MLEVKYNNDVISVKSDYNKTFVRKAHSLHGVWNGAERAWEFTPEMTDAVRSLLKECYGDDGCEKQVKVRIDLDACHHVETDGINLYLCGKVLIATRYERDQECVLPNDVYCVKGEFYEAGGSFKHPRVTWDDGTVVEMSIPENVYGECKQDAGIELVDDKADAKARISSLESERMALMKRLDEINNELEKLQRK